MNADMVDSLEIETDEIQNLEDSFAVWPSAVDVQEVPTVRDDQALMDGSITVERDLSMFDRLDVDDVSSEGTDDDCDSVDMIGTEDSMNEYQPLVDDEAFGDFVEAKSECRHDPDSSSNICASRTETETETAAVEDIEANVCHKAECAEGEKVAYRSIEPLTEEKISKIKAAMQKFKLSPRPGADALFRSYDLNNLRLGDEVSTASTKPTTQAAAEIDSELIS